MLNKEKSMREFFRRSRADGNLYAHMGAQEKNGKTQFRVWAPNAKQVFLIGSFNGWSDSLPMRRSDGDGIWETEVSRIDEGGIYKYKIITDSGGALFKADPYAKELPCGEESASVICADAKFEWLDGTWLENRKRIASGDGLLSRPINIYQLSPAFWKLKNSSRQLSSNELARELVPYVKQMGYTHVNLLCECENDSYFAPPASWRAKEYKAFVDLMHRAGVGVFQTVAPGSYSRSEQGMRNFDGYPIYEDLASCAVQSFYASGVAYLLSEFHLDGIVLYLPKDNCEGTVNAISKVMRERFPDAILISDNVSVVSERLSLSAGEKRAEALRAYLERDPIYRRYHHNDLLAAIDSDADEASLFGLSHRNIEIGKQSLLSRAFGSYDEKFATVRSFLGCMMTSRGKKLLSSGCEIGQFKSFERSSETEWFLLAYAKHHQLQKYVADLNMLYLENKALWDDGENSFEWVDKDSEEISVVTYKRTDKDNNELYVVVNFTPVYRKDYRLFANKGSSYSEIFNSDALQYGGKGVVNRRDIVPSENREISINLPPLSIIVLRKK